MYTITYNLEYTLGVNATNHPDNPTVYTVNSDTITLKAPTGAGNFIFVGWYIDNEGDSREITEIKAGSVGDIRLYSSWRSARYNILFSGNGATSGNMKSMECIDGFYYKLRSNNFKRKGYVFTGWNTKKNGKGKTYKDKSKMTMQASDGESITLYAQWKKK